MTREKMLDKHEEDPMANVVAVMLAQLSLLYMSHLVGKPTMWFPNRSDTNGPVQAQKRARSLKFRI